LALLSFAAIPGFRLNGGFHPRKTTAILLESVAGQLAGNFVRQRDAQAPALQDLPEAPARDWGPYQSSIMGSRSCLPTRCADLAHCQSHTGSQIWQTSLCVFLNDRRKQTLAQHKECVHTDP
jgi:hypothetical protein